MDTSSATASPARQAAGHDQPEVYCRYAMSTPTKPITEPTDRSMWRATMTSTITVDTMPTTAVCCATL
jgi:hypothetical protein